MVLRSGSVRGRSRRTSMAMALLVGVALLPSAPARAAPFQLADVNPDDSIVPQPLNGSQGGRVNGLKVVPGSNQVAYASEWGACSRPPTAP